MKSVQRGKLSLATWSLVAAGAFVMGAAHGGPAMLVVAGIVLLVLL